MKIRVVHLTSVHSWNDNRIFHKECLSLAQEGFVVFLIAPATEQKVVNGVQIIPLSEVRSRLLRILIQPIRLFIKGIRLKGHIYHFHDPELIITGLLFRLVGKEVIYDIHEDNTTIVQARIYISEMLKQVITFFLDKVERFTSFLFHIIIAESYYEERHPGAIKILNYPVLDNHLTCNQNHGPSNKNYGLLYTGKITEKRGAHIYASIAAIFPDLRVYLIGRCTNGLSDKLENIAGNSNGLCIEGKGYFVDPIWIREKYREQCWLAGLCIFPYSDHYLYKEPTKLFEYMMYGIPILCSDFPAWKALVEKEECGLTVNPNDPQDIKEKIEYLLSNRSEVKLMGSRGQAVVMNKYNWKSQEKKLVELYKSVVSEKFLS